MALDSVHTSPQPAPKGEGDSVTVAVMKDLATRREAGTKKYGTELLTNNGRNALVDAYQEALDLVMYLKQQLMEDAKKHRFERQQMNATICRHCCMDLALHDCPLSPLVEANAPA